MDHLRVWIVFDLMSILLAFSYFSAYSEIWSPLNIPLLLPQYFCHSITSGFPLLTTRLAQILLQGRPNINSPQVSFDSTIFFSRSWKIYSINSPYFLINIPIAQYSKVRIYKENFFCLNHIGTPFLLWSNMLALLVTSASCGNLP